MRGKQGTRKRRGIVRGRLVYNPLRPSERLVYVRDFLDWVYAKGKSASELKEEGLALWFGLLPEQLREQGPRCLSNIYEDVERWDWPAMQTEARQRIERVLLPSREAKRLPPVSAPRVLGLFTNREGEAYWYYDTDPMLPDTGEEWVSRIIDRTLYDLRDMSVKVTGRCEECGRLFIRQRPSVSRYCSPGCRHLAWLKAHGFKPPKETKSKGATHEPTKRARNKPSLPSHPER